MEEFIRKSETRYITVTDDWFPNIDGNKIVVKISTGDFNGYYVKITAFGGDDNGVELYYDAYDLAQLEEIYRHLKFFVFDRIPDGVDHEWFFEHGFLNF